MLQDFKKQVMSSQTSRTKVCLESTVNPPPPQKKKPSIHQKKLSFKCLANKSNLINTSVGLKNHKMIPGNKGTRKSSVTMPFFPGRGAEAEKDDTLKDYTKVKWKHTLPYGSQKKSYPWLLMAPRTSPKSLHSFSPQWWRFFSWNMADYVPKDVLCEGLAEKRARRAKKILATDLHHFRVPCC